VLVHLLGLGHTVVDCAASVKYVVMGTEFDEKNLRLLDGIAGKRYNLAFSTDLAAVRTRR
jgi:hypothetical protein